jgi:predicted nucleotidyltransferase/DNA-binding XRE family transcriptional regulator
VTAGSVLRQARARAGLTQRALAERAGVSQSVVAAYESDARAPSLATLAALVEASGISLTLELGPALPERRPPTAGPIGHRLQRRRAAVLAVAAKHGVSDVRVFGSVARGEDGPDSDLDLLVHLPEGAGLFALGRFRQDLEQLLHVEVDVVPEDGVKPRLRAGIEQDLVPL